MIDRQTYQSDESSDSLAVHRTLGSETVPTQTIDINSLSCTGVPSSGGFDLRGIGSTSFGKLLDAIPLPSLVTNQWHRVVFVNQACGKFSLRGDVVGRMFEDFVPSPNDAHRARVLENKAVMLLERAFATSKPQIAEAILQFDQQRIWCRLHLRSIKITSQKFMLVLIEDLTLEKTEQRLSQRERIRIREDCRDLEERLTDLKEQLGEASEDLSMTTHRIKRMEEELRGEKQKFQTISELVPLAIATVGCDGSIKSCNARFKQLFGDRPEGIPCHHSRVEPSGNGNAVVQLMRSLRLDSPGVGDERAAEPKLLIVTDENGTQKIVGLRRVKLDSGDYLIACEDIYPGHVARDQAFVAAQEGGLI